MLHNHFEGGPISEDMKLINYVLSLRHFKKRAVQTL